MARNRNDNEVNVNEINSNVIQEVSKPVTETPKTKVAFSNVGTIRSGLNHPVMLSYDGSVMMVPPHGNIPDVDFNKLGSIPQGIRFIHNK